MTLDDLMVNWDAACEGGAWLLYLSGWEWRREHAYAGSYYDRWSNVSGWATSWRGFTSKSGRYGATLCALYQASWSGH